MQKSEESRPARADALARGVSIAFIPPTFSALAFTVLVLVWQHGSVPHRTIVWAVAVACSGVLQMLYVLRLRRDRKVSAYDVPERLQRTGPYLISVGVSLAGLAALLFLGASLYVWSLMWAYAVNTLILALINRWWKISAHLMGMTGPLTALLPVFGSWLALALLPAALLGWARVRLRSHTVPQVLAGAAAGVILTALQLFLVSAYAGRFLDALR